MTEIDDYVWSQQQEGRLDSSGRFSMVRAQALERMSRFVLGSDTRAVLKIPARYPPTTG